MKTCLRMPQVEAITGRKKPTIYADIAAGKFPRPIKIGARAVAWISTDIEKWLDERIAAKTAEGGST